MPRLKAVCRESWPRSGGWPGVTYQPQRFHDTEYGCGKRYHVFAASREARGIITDVSGCPGTAPLPVVRAGRRVVRGTMKGSPSCARSLPKAAAIMARHSRIKRHSSGAAAEHRESAAVRHLGDVFEDTAELPSFRASGKLIGQYSNGRVKYTPSPRSRHLRREICPVFASHPGDLK